MTALRSFLYIYIIILLLFIYFLMKFPYLRARILLFNTCPILLVLLAIPQLFNWRLTIICFISTNLISFYSFCLGKVERIGNFFFFLFSFFVRLQNFCSLYLFFSLITHEFSAMHFYIRQIQ